MVFWCLLFTVSIDEGSSLPHAITRLNLGGRDLAVCLLMIFTD